MAKVNWVIIGPCDGLKPIRCQTPNHYLNQCWLIVNWNTMNNCQWICIKIPKFTSKKVHSKMLSAKFWSQYVNQSLYIAPNVLLKVMSTQLIISLFRARSLSCGSIQPRFQKKYVKVCGKIRGMVPERECQNDLTYFADSLWVPAWICNLMDRNYLSIPKLQ